jgi:hypothetical protein
MIDQLRELDGWEIEVVSGGCQPGCGCPGCPNNLPAETTIVDWSSCVITNGGHQMLCNATVVFNK